MADDLFARVPNLDRAALEQWRNEALANFLSHRTDENFKRLCRARQQVFAELIRTNPRKRAAQQGTTDGK